MKLRDFAHFTFPKKLPAEFGGGWMLVTPRADMRVLKSGWQPSAKDLMLVVNSIVKPGSVVWDIGANQGILSALAASKVGAEGAVYALEADPFYANLVFRSSMRLSDNYQPINVLCAAISDTSGVLEFGISNKGHARNQIASLGDKADFEAVKFVPALKGDDLLNSWRAPDFIKMDVEGAELSALAGSDKILSEVRPVFYIEVADENSAAASDLFKRYDYDIFHLKGDGGEELTETCSFYTVARPRA